MKKEKEHCIILDSPARSWQQSHLLGNGFMGQALYGQPYQEVIELSESTFFSGSDSQSPYRSGAAQVFEEMRLAATEEDWERLKLLTQQFMGKRGNYGTNLPVGKLLLDFGQGDGTKEYRRSLDLDRGIFQVRFSEGTQCGEAAVKREAFSSHADRVFVMLLEDGRQEGMDLRVTFDGGRMPFKTFCREEAIGFRVQALEELHSDGTEGVRLTGAVRVEISDGEKEVSGKEIRIRGAHQAVLYLAMATDYSPEPGSGRKIDENEVFARVQHTLEDAPALRERHIRDFSELMGRQRLTLGRSMPGGNAEESAMRKQAGAGESSLRQTELMFQYGRYLLACSSREDSILPAPLQGVWNDDVACRIGWTCDMHLDINTQMNYWLSEAGNLRECHMPVFRWMENRVIPNGRNTAARCYGRPGWVGELVSNAWGYAAPYWDKSLSPCPTGGIWQASDYMEHYRFGQDMEFLRKRAYPVLREAAEFFLSYVFEDGSGRLTSGPSISPENSFLADGKKCYASNGCTYEILMIRELFAEYLEACESLTPEHSLQKKETRSAAEDQTENGCITGSRMQDAGRNRKNVQDACGNRKNVQDAGGNRKNVQDAGGNRKNVQSACGHEEGLVSEDEFAQQVRAAMERLLPYRVLKDGTLAEWSHDAVSADPQHRHTSHLLGLFPYGQITPENTPELAEAARETIRKKLTPVQGWEDTGWARSLLTLYSARLQNAEEAYLHLKSMEEKLTGPNLLVMHPPTRGAASFMEVYELDGNTGYSMAVLEMLVQSHNGVIRLLPALPEEWKNGSIEGVLARGGVELSVEWSDGCLTRVRAIARASRLCRFAYGDRVKEQWLEAGQETILCFQEAGYC